MIVEIWYDIMCNKCGCHLSTDFNAGMYLNKKDIVIRAKKEGWKYLTSTKENICSNCLKSKN